MATTNQIINSENWFMKHKWTSAVLILVVLLFVLSLSFEGWYNLWAKVLHTTGQPNYNLILPICKKACDQADYDTYCDTIHKVSYGEEIRTTFLHGDELSGYKAAYTYFEKIYGTCDNMARGYINAVNKDGERQDFGVSYPNLGMQQCQNVACDYKPNIQRNA